jgi:hypothetical protein
MESIALGEPGDRILRQFIIDYRQLLNSFYHMVSVFPPTGL